jgi:[acyl-carrier-protein] S-malonyltransferase
MIGFLLPGQGAQYVGMGRELYERWPAARATYAQASAVLGYDIARLCFEGPAEELRRTERTQPALLVTSIAAYRVLAEHGIEPALAAGLSLGEYSALVIAGALGFDEAVALVEKRGRFMQEAVPEGQGGMAAILGLPAETVERLCREAAGVGVVEPANYNCPGQLVVSGQVEAVRRCVELATVAGARRAVMLEVSAPFHCSMMAVAARRLAAELDRVTFRSPRIPVVANATADVVITPAGIRAALERQVCSPVRWEQSLRRMEAERCRLFVEVGAGTVLSGFVKRTLPGARSVQVGDDSSLAKLLDLLKEVC